jgi:hypothetical protein
VRANWSGLLGRFPQVFPGLEDHDVLRGIPGSPTDHHGAPYSLTEEFVSVYRMHTLMPDHYTLCSAETGGQLDQLDLPGVSGRRGLDVLERFEPADLFYSLGIAHPGAVRLHNYPTFLQHLEQDNGERFDLGAVDILRDRERGVPRYNQFRRLLHKPAVRSFDEISDVPGWCDEIRAVYENDLEKVDTMVGLMCEPLPQGFGFSETAFRIFLLMASRRLKSDRFLSKDFRAEVYTRQGLDWVNQTTMIDVISRHFPSLAEPMKGLDSAFKPWTPKTRAVT